MSSLIFIWPSMSPAVLSVKWWQHEVSNQGTANPTSSTQPKVRRCCLHRAITAWKSGETGESQVGQGGSTLVLAASGGIFSFLSVYHYVIVCCKEEPSRENAMITWTPTHSRPKWDVGHRNLQSKENDRQSLDAELWAVHHLLGERSVQ